MAEVLNVTIRKILGSSEARRIRRAGRIPAVLYGHGEANLSLSVAADQVAAALRHGSKLVDLQGDVNESALIRELQWDPFGVDLLHVDFTRVSVGETVEVTVGVELRGEAPGVKAGGVIEHLLHEVDIECPAGSLPDKFEVNVNSLQLGHSITAAVLPLPQGARLISDLDAIIVQCVEPEAEAEEAELPAESAEPEVIGRKVEQEEE